MMSVNIHWLAELKFYEVLILIRSRIKGYFLWMQYFFPWFVSFNYTFRYFQNALQR